MKPLPFKALACPLDGEALVESGRSWTCANGHSFDIAKKGHIHLLPVHKKRSLDPGDNKEMVAARQRFLNAGYYSPIADAVNRAVLKRQGEDAIHCLDAGCGEGYYLRALAASVDDRVLVPAGLDISKWAILAASRLPSGITWIVGSNANLPILPDSLDVVLCMFGYPVYPEFARVLKRGGLFIQVDTGPDHLRELREVIYQNMKESDSARPALPSEFCPAATEDLRFSLDLKGADTLADLLAMTPHYYRIRPEGRAKLAALDQLTVTVDVTLSIFSRQ